MDVSGKVGSFWLGVGLAGEIRGLLRLVQTKGPGDGEW
jgi:hypothetical protein